MDLILNGHSQSIDTSDCANLAELVAIAEQIDLKQEACVVVSVDVDGEVVSPEDFPSLEKRSLDGVARVSIERRPSRAIAVSVLEQGADYTQRIAAAIGQAVEQFRAGRSDLGSGVLADVTDSLTVLTGITYSVASILTDESQALTATQEDIVPWLQELVEAQTEEDPIRIADLLEYEILSRVEAWGAVMQTLAKDKDLSSDAANSVLPS